MAYRLDYSLPSAHKSSLPDPPGFISSRSTKDLAKGGSAVSNEVALKQHKKETELKLRRAWDLALAYVFLSVLTVPFLAPALLSPLNFDASRLLVVLPAKSLPMQAIMLYFSGSGVQIFSLGMIFMLLTSPITAVVNIGKAFQPFRPVVSLDGKSKPATPTYTPLIGPMIVFVLCQGLVLGLGLYKCSSMGILPTGTGDWLQFETRNDPPEWSAIRANELG